MRSLKALKHWEPGPEVMDATMYTDSLENLLKAEYTHSPGQGDLWCLGLRSQISITCLWRFPMLGSLVLWAILSERHNCSRMAIADTLLDTHAGLLQVGYRWSSECFSGFGWGTAYTTMFSPLDFNFSPISIIFRCYCHCYCQFLLLCLCNFCLSVYVCDTP